MFQVKDIEEWAPEEDSPAFIATMAATELLKKYQIVRLKNATLTLRGNLEDHGSVNNEIQQNALTRIAE